MNSLVLDYGHIALILVSVKIEPFTAISNIDYQIISVEFEQSDRNCEIQNKIFWWSFLPQNVDADTDKNNEDAGYCDHCKHPVVENTNFYKKTFQNQAILYTVH